MDKYIPYVGIVELVGTNDPAVDIPVVVVSPTDEIVNLDAELVANDNVFVPDKYIPFVGAVELVGINDADVLVPVVTVFPVEDIENLIAEFVANATVFAADKYIPFVGTTEPVGMWAAEVRFPVVVMSELEEIDPEKVNTPELFMFSLIDELVEKAKVFAADKYIPFVGAVELVGTNDAAVLVPEIAKSPKLERLPPAPVILPETVRFPPLVNVNKLVAPLLICNGYKGAVVPIPTAEMLLML